MDGRQAGGRVDLPERRGFSCRGGAAILVVLGVLASAGTAGPATTGCALFDETAPALSASGVSGQLRERPDDRDPGSLVPAGVATVIDVDMAALRRSAWFGPALEARDPRARSAKAQALGFDDVNDADRIIYAITSAGAELPTLVILQGRMDPSSVDQAYRARWPGAVVDRWRGIPMLGRGENSLAFLTGRTFTSGAPASVRAVIDRAFGVGPDPSADPALGPIRRALCPEGLDARPAFLATVTVDDRLRTRMGDTSWVPSGLGKVGVRVDVGQTLEATAIGLLDDREAARTLARRLNDLISNPAIRLAARGLGLGTALSEVRITQDGARVVARASISDEHRAALAGILRRWAESSSESPGAGGFGSW